MTDPGNCSVKAREGMRSEEYAALERLLRDVRPRTTLEIGMATGGSSIEICKTLRDVGGETHVAIDPYQSDPGGWNNQGINNVKAAGFDGLLEPIADFDYLALPKLVEQGRRFDFVLIDGWHSFDYTLVDLFYADLLLNVDGVVAIHDTGWPAVHRACRFLETHKPYDLVSPPPSVIVKPLLGRLGRRVGQVLRGPATMRQAHERRRVWFSLAAYRKRADHQVGNDWYAKF